jgi:hypothetical protein
VFAGILAGNTMSANRAEWSGYSLAAQSQAVQRMELVRSASWDTSAVPVVDQTPALIGTNTGVLDLPINSTNAVLVTNITTITNLTLATNPIVVVKMIRVDSIWNWRQKRLFTNTLVTYRAPDQ